MKVWYGVLGLLSMEALAPTGGNAQTYPGEAFVTMHRGLIAHSVYNIGASGRREPSSNTNQASFSYPMGRDLSIYAGGLEREGWNIRNNTGGEGFWVLSILDGAPHISVAGNRIVSPDVVSLPHRPASYPEAYVGDAANEEWAMAYRTQGGAELAETRGTNFTLGNLAVTNWWPTVGPVRSPPAVVGSRPVMVWNFGFGRYRSGEAFIDRVARGEMAPLDAPAWAARLSEDDFPELVAIAKAKSRETGLQWSRRWYQWGHTDYDDFIINDSMVENTSAVKVEGVYIVIQNRFISGAASTWRGTSLTGGVSSWTGPRCRALIVRSQVPARTWTLRRPSCSTLAGMGESMETSLKPSGSSLPKTTSRALPAASSVMWVHR